MKPINEVAMELQREGWHIVWKSEVEALAIKDEALEAQRMGIVELMESLGVKLKKVGREYTGLCPFHDDRKPSLSVSREKGLWHCFGCGKGGDARKFIENWEALCC
jgi:DNA primase